MCRKILAARKLLERRRREEKAFVKFTGPRFFEGSSEADEIRIARVIYSPMD